MENKLLSVPQFHSKDEEVHYWRDLAQRMYQRQEQIQHDLEEYQENSITVEKELETSYEQSIENNLGLQLANNKLARENEELKERLAAQVAVCCQQQKEIDQMEKFIDELSDQSRQLEQDNENLERANRELKGSEQALEEQLNDVIERFALLETDIEEKEGLRIIIQRLKDENKDLKRENKAKLRKTQGSPLTRTRKMSSAMRYQRRNSTESEESLSDHEKSLSVHEEHQLDFNCKNDKDNSLEYISELEKEINCLKRNQRPSKIALIEVATKSNNTEIESSFFYKDNFDNEAKVGIPDYLLQSIENKDPSLQEAQVRLRSKGGVSVERAPLPLSIHSKAQDESARPLAASRISRILEKRMKKAKTEEKRQNLMHFLKRFRYRQPNWMSKRH